MFCIDYILIIPISIIPTYYLK
nr:cytochrome b6/f complex subunit VI [Sparganium erectum subsp. microcarpum]UKS07645.1 cytochrome b6/f complex subunit VI [Sparganium erectum subsp. microcarpum]